jgi:hypothetical protein
MHHFAGHLHDGRAAYHHRAALSQANGDRLTPQPCGVAICSTAGGPAEGGSSWP